MTIIKIGILGPLKVEFDHVEARLNGEKLRHILTILALRAGADVMRDELIDELNLMGTTSDAINALHAHITRLRRWLRKNGQSPRLVETVNSRYRLNISEESVDAHRFKILVERGVGIGSETPLVVSRILDDALSLWRGTALADALDGQLGVSAADELENWRVIAEEALLDSWISLGSSHKAVANAKKFITNSPLNEAMYVQYMRALCRIGRYAEAMDIYREAENMLRAELDVSPGAELRAAAATASSQFCPQP